MSSGEGQGNDRDGPFRFRLPFVAAGVAYVGAAGLTDVRAAAFGAAGFGP